MVFIYIEIYLVGGNAKVFGKQYNPDLIIPTALANATEIFSISNKIKYTNMPRFIKVKWTSQEIGWFKLNCDGVSIGNPGSVGAGALIRDFQVTWVSGCHRFLNYSSKNCC